MNNQIHYLNPFMVQAAGGGGAVLHIFDEKNQDVGDVPPNPLPDPPKQARTDLLALLTVSGEEDFEAYSDGDFIGTTVTTFSANGITATISAIDSGTLADVTIDELVGSVQSDTGFGRYNTSPEGSGTQYWNFNAFSDGSTWVSAVLTFSTPIAAFWLYATDTGDFDATLEVTFHKTGGGTDVYTPDAPAGAANGALNFFGIVDARGTTTYDAVSFRRTNGSDVIGIDGIGFATAAQIA